MTGRRRKAEAQKDSMDRWLISYADFITLLMIFFVLMYSFSKMDLEKYYAMADSLSIVFTGQTLENLETSGAISPGLSGDNAVDQISANQIEEIQRQIEEFFSNDVFEAVESPTETNPGKLADYITVSSRKEAWL